jgi:orotate phosphoribosyltransferase
MKTFQKEFLDLAIQHKALSFGKFILKSGRESPYFFNMATFNTGTMLATVGKCYAQAIESQKKKIAYDMLFGPAYKGIPLVTSTAIALATLYHKDVPYAFNRKEAKDHGEGGLIVGAPLKGRVLMIDDVITKGTALSQSIELFAKFSGVTLAGVVIGLYRQERMDGSLSTAQEFEQKYKVPVISIIHLGHLLEYLSSESSFKLYVPAIMDYREKYGVT